MQWAFFGVERGVRKRFLETGVDFYDEGFSCGVFDYAGVRKCADGDWRLSREGVDCMCEGCKRAFSCDFHRERGETSREIVTDQWMFGPFMAKVVLFLLIFCFDQLSSLTTKKSQFQI